MQPRDVAFTCRSLLNHLSVYQIDFPLSIGPSDVQTEPVPCQIDTSSHRYIITLQLAQHMD
jgi:hypothetical protein